MDPCIFQIDGEDSSTARSGFTEGEVWNGWDVVWIDARDFEALCLEFTDSDWDGWKNLKASYDPETRQHLYCLEGFCTIIRDTEDSNPEHQ